MKDLSYLEALKRIFELVVDKLRKAGEYTEKIYKGLISAIFGTAIEFFGLDKCDRQPENVSMMPV